MRLTEAEADVCSRMLTYAHVCSRMRLTEAEADALPLRVEAEILSLSE